MSMKKSRKYAVRHGILVDEKRLVHERRAVRYATLYIMSLRDIMDSRDIFFTNITSLTGQYSTDISLVT